MRVLALTRYDSAGASSRYRVFQYVPGLRAAGIEVEVSHLLGRGYVEGLYAGKRGKVLTLARSAVARMLALLKWTRFDLVWLEKEILPYFPALLERVAGRLRTPLVVDYDDAIFHNYDLHRSTVLRAVLGSKIDQVMRAATLVVAGNEYLASRAREAGAAQVEIIPTVIDLARYTPAARPVRSGRLVVGWIGSPSTQEYLRPIAPALAAFCAETGATLQVIGARADFSLPGVPLTVVQWREESEVADLEQFDIGLMPLTDDPWSRGKCGLKLIQYMGASLPVVASPVGVNAQIVRVGETGFLPASPADWLSALRTLGSNAQMRTAMGIAGRQRAEQLFSLQSALPRLIRVLRQAVRRG